MCGCLIAIVHLIANDKLVDDVDGDDDIGDEQTFHLFFVWLSSQFESPLESDGKILKLVKCAKTAALAARW